MKIDRADIDFAIVLGHDLQLVCTETTREWGLYAATADGDRLAKLGACLREPSDGIIGAARASAIAQFPDRAGWTLKGDAPPAAREVKPHAFERDRNAKAGHFICKHCPFEPKHAVHDTGTRAASPQ